MGEDSTTVTHLLKAWSGGDKAALEEVTPRVYLELRRMAARYMRHESDGYSLPATALVHEVCLPWLRWMASVGRIELISSRYRQT
jgi:hypothetical protein